MGNEDGVKELGQAETFLERPSHLESLRLQFLLNDTVACAAKTTNMQRFYQRTALHIPSPILSDLRAIRHAISEDPADPRWCKPIGLLVPRDPTIITYTDASSNGMGGWSAKLDHMWRLTYKNLTTCGLSSPSHSFANKQYHEPAIEEEPVHINILEFLAIIIELWICTRQLQSTIPVAGGHIIQALADNTSALSWLRYATRTKRPVVGHLARFLVGLLSHPFPSSTLRVQGRHLAGTTNTGADLLSRFELAPSWESAMEQFQPLAALRTCLLPREPVSMLVQLISAPQTEAWFDNAMTRLWTIAPPSFTSGSSRLANTQTSLSTL